MKRLSGVTRGALALMIVTVGAACSDGDDDAGGSADSPERDRYVEALAGSLGSGELDDEQRECFATSLVDTVGVDELSEKVQPEDIDADFAPTDVGIVIDDEKGSDFYGRLTDCIDLRALVLEQLSAGQELPEDVVACFEENLDDDLLEQIIVGSFTQGAAAADDPELAEALNSLSSECAPAAGG
jgi:hypothetical protein